MRTHPRTRNMLGAHLLSLRKNSPPVPCFDGCHPRHRAVRPGPRSPSISPRMSDAAAVLRLTAHVQSCGRALHARLVLTGCGVHLPRQPPHQHVLPLRRRQLRGARLPRRAAADPRLLDRGGFYPRVERRAHRVHAPQHRGRRRGPGGPTQLHSVADALPLVASKREYRATLLLVEPRVACKKSSVA
jgi:hypothetical protein